MKRSPSTTLAATLTLVAATASAQLSDCDFQRPLEGVAPGWRTAGVPPEVFAQAASSLSDLRVYGLTAADTLEVPYVLRVARGAVTVTERAVPVLNRGRQGGARVFTVETGDAEPLDELRLDLGNDNFEARATLEGSADLATWTTVLEGYRLLGIRNAGTDYKVETLRFPRARFRYFRVRVSGLPELRLRGVYARTVERTPARRQRVPVVGLTAKRDRDARLSTVEVALAGLLPVDEVAVYVRDTVTYLRPLRIASARDTVAGPGGRALVPWVPVVRARLSSAEEARFPLDETTVARRLRLVVEDGDNLPLTIDSVAVYSYARELVLRVPPAGRYVMAYGCAQRRAPDYDLEDFGNQIPARIQPARVGQELDVRVPEEATRPWLENPLWLWGSLVLVAGVLGWVAVGLMREPRA